MQRVNPGGTSPVLLVGDHAGDAIPRRLGDLGVSAADRRRHIALDIGTAALGRALSVRLDAAFLSQRYSRLVVDCNRDPDAADAMPEESDGTRVPANIGLTAAARAARIEAVHAPYQSAIAAEIDARRTRGQATVLVSLHSFTPRMAGRDRPWHAGILHDGRDDAFARRLLALLEARGDIVVGDNEPYAMNGIDHSVPRHAFPRGLPYAEIEVRQDCIGDDAGVARWTGILGDAIVEAMR